LPGGKDALQAGEEAAAHGLCGTGDEDGAAGAVEDALREIAHDVVLQGAARLGGAGDDEVVVAFVELGEDLVEDEAVADPHLGGSLMATSTGGGMALMTS